MNRSPVNVVSLCARADLNESPDGGTSCQVREFAVLSDGRKVPVLDDRGWTSTTSVGIISLSHVVRNVYTVVLPDDAEETGEHHEWGRFVERLREAGVVVTGDQLRALPYHVTIGVPDNPALWSTPSDLLLSITPGIPGS